MGHFVTLKEEVKAIVAVFLVSFHGKIHIYLSEVTQKIY